MYDLNIIDACIQALASLPTSETTPQEWNEIHKVILQLIKLKDVLKNGGTKQSTVD